MSANIKLNINKLSTIMLMGCLLCASLSAYGEGPVDNYVKVYTVKIVNNSADKANVTVTNIDHGIFYQYSGMQNQPGYPSGGGAYYVPANMTANIYMYHHYYGSWVDSSSYWSSFLAGSNITVTYGTEKCVINVSPQKNGSSGDDYLDGATDEVHWLNIQDSSDGHTMQGCNETDNLYVFYNNVDPYPDISTGKGLTCYVGTVNTTKYTGC